MNNKLFLYILEARNIKYRLVMMRNFLEVCYVTKTCNQDSPLCFICQSEIELKIIDFSDFPECTLVYITKRLVSDQYKKNRHFKMF